MDQSTAIDYMEDEILAWGSVQGLAKHLYDKGYRLDPYPNGKSKDELLAIIDAKEEKLARARNLLRDLSANLGDLGYYLQDHKAINLKKIADNVANAMAFLAETITVKS
jgi:hypothetical protein